MKKLQSLQDYPIAETGYDHTKLEKFLNQYDDIECYSRDGDIHYLVVMKPYSAFGIKQANLGLYIFNHFHYSVIALHQTSHSGYVYRDAFRLIGGYTDPMKNPKNYYECRYIYETDEMLGKEENKIRTCDNCKRVQQCYDYVKQQKFCKKCLEKTQEL